jgi:hypothetical protein
MKYSESERDCERNIFTKTLDLFIKRKWFPKEHCMKMTVLLLFFLMILAPLIMRRWYFYDTIICNNAGINDILYNNILYDTKIQQMKYE